MVLRKSLENQIANLEESLAEMESNYNKVAKREIERLEQKVRGVLNNNNSNNNVILFFCFINRRISN